MFAMQLRKQTVHSMKDAHRMFDKITSKEKLSSQFSLLKNVMGELLKIFMFQWR